LSLNKKGTILKAMTRGVHKYVLTCTDALMSCWHGCQGTTVLLFNTLCT